jgi:very-short-patch-repair endonuclease
MQRKEDFHIPSPLAGEGQDGGMQRKEDFYIPSPLVGEGQDGGMSSTKARELRKNLTDAEQRLWQGLKRRQIEGVKFRRQQPIGDFIVDFVSFERRLIVEVDGGQHAEQLAYDEKRTRWLEAQGYKVLRFWDNDVLANTEAVMQAVFDAVEQRASTPHLNPPPQGGRKK